MEYKLGEIEMRFADLIWDNEPLSSGELAKLSEKTLNWKNPLPTQFCAEFVTGDCFGMKTVW